MESYVPLQNHVHEVNYPPVILSICFGRFSKIMEKKSGSAILCSSYHRNFVNWKTWDTRVWAVCRREMLHFIVFNDEELKEKVLDGFVAYLLCQQRGW